MIDRSRFELTSRVGDAISGRLAAIYPKNMRFTPNGVAGCFCDESSANKLIVEVCTGTYIQNVTSGAQMALSVLSIGHIVRRLGRFARLASRSSRRLVRSAPRAFAYPLVGALIALSGPVGLAVTQVIASGAMPGLDALLHEIQRTPLTYTYLLFWSASIVALPGHLLGRLADRARTLSITDPLTGLFNRRYFAERLTAEMSRARQSTRTTCVLCLDLDRLKGINDAAGHAAGDLALITVSRALSNNVRATDVVARFGGDEFVVLLPETEVSETVLIAERIAAEIAKHRDGDETPLTVSIGIAALSASATPTDALAAADAALYGAKAAGGGHAAIAVDQATPLPLSSGSVDLRSTPRALDHDSNHWRRP
jgi:diguanylate cyclase (GGDEF)-like protein